MFVPTFWLNDVATITRVSGSTILIDDVPVDDAMFIPAGDAHEVAWVPIEDGIHRFESEDQQGFSVIIVGYDDDDSYAYLGGTGTAKINPIPEG